MVIELTDEQSHLLAEALDSHMYWQLAKQEQRRDGFVFYEDDDENAAELADCEALVAHLTGGPCRRNDALAEAG